MEKELINGIKNIGGYIPYNLNVQRKAWDDETYKYVYEVWDSNEILDNLSYTYFAKTLPILYPISEINREIEFRGNKFVPIIEISKMCFTENSSLSWEEHDGFYDVYLTMSNYDDYDIYDFRWDHTHGCFVLSYNGDEKCVIDKFGDYRIIDKLYEWMIDFRGLIDVDEAISVLSLKENPYLK